MKRLVLILSFALLCSNMACSGESAPEEPSTASLQPAPPPAPPAPPPPPPVDPADTKMMAFLFMHGSKMEAVGAGRALPQRDWRWARFDLRHVLEGYAAISKTPLQSRSLRFAFVPAEGKSGKMFAFYVSAPKRGKVYYAPPWSVRDYQPKKHTPARPGSFGPQIDGVVERVRKAVVEKNCDLPLNPQSDDDAGRMAKACPDMQKAFASTKMVLANQVKLFVFHKRGGYGVDLRPDGRGGFVYLRPHVSW